MERELTNADAMPAIKMEKWRVKSAQLRDCMGLPSDYMPWTSQAEVQCHGMSCAKSILDLVNRVGRLCGSSKGLPPRALRARDEAGVLLELLPES